MALLAPTSQAAGLNAIAAISPYSNLHSATTSTTGSNELGSTRQAVTWSTASSGTPSLSNTNAISWTLAATTTAAYVGYWSASTAGNFSFGAALSPSVTTGSSAGTVTAAVGALTATDT